MMKSSYEIINSGVCPECNRRMRSSKYEENNGFDWYCDNCNLKYEFQDDMSAGSYATIKLNNKHTCPHSGTTVAANCTDFQREFKICIDFGHFPYFTGAINQKINPLNSKKGYLTESDLNVYIGMKLGNYLCNYYDVLMPYYYKLSRFLGRNLRQRARFANDKNCDLFISIHFNASEDTSFWGTEIITSLGETDSDLFAENILDKMADTFIDTGDIIHRYSEKNRKLFNLDGFKSRGEKDINLSVLRRTKMPAILWEVDFLSNNDRVMWALKPEHQMIMFRAIHEGIQETIK